MFVKDKLIEQTNAGNVSSKKCYGPFLTLSVNDKFRGYGPKRNMS